MGGVLEKDPAPHLTARQEQEHMGLLDYIRTADPRKVQAVEVQKGEEHVKLLDSIKHCFVSLDAPAMIFLDPEGNLGLRPERKVPLEATDKAGFPCIGASSHADVHAKLSCRVPCCGSPLCILLRHCTSSEGATRQICLGSEVRSRTEHELELKEKLRVKYDAQGVLLKEKDVEIARLKCLMREKETESAEVSCLHDQVSVLTAEKSSLSTEVSFLRYSQAACDEARCLISSLSSERDGLASEVLYNRVAELEAHVMDVSGRLEGEFYPAYLTALAGRRWLLTHGMELAMVKCLKSPEYQGILGHALGRAVDYGMQEGLAAGHEHGVAGTPLSAVMAYNPEAAEAHYLDAVRALEEADFPLVQLLKSKKDSGIDEVLDCFLLDGPLADLPEAAHLQPCLEQLSVPIYHADIKTVVGETSLSFALLNVHTRAEGARKHAAALRQLMVDIISHPLSSQNLIGEAGTSATTFFVEDLDTDEDLGSVVCMPQFEDLRFEIFP
ncbi:hypothetical protein Tco_1490444 [Tanacetum coccineum]